MIINTIQSSIRFTICYLFSDLNISGFQTLQTIIVYIIDYNALILTIPVGYSAIIYVWMFVTASYRLYANFNQKPAAEP